MTAFFVGWVERKWRDKRGDLQAVGMLRLFGKSLWRSETQRF